MRRRLELMARGNQHFELDPQTGAWTELATERGVNVADWAWAAVFFDVDNDRDKDLFVANGFTSSSESEAPDY